MKPRRPISRNDLRKVFPDQRMLLAFEELLGSDASNLLFPIRTVGSDTTAFSSQDHTLLVNDDTATTDVAVTLPPADKSNGRVARIKKIGTTYNVIIQPSGTDTIDGAATKTLTTQYELATLHCNGAAWHVI